MSIDEKTVHSIGNGQMTVYGKGADIIQAFSPCNAPSSFSLSWENPRPCHTEWVEHTNCFRHILTEDNRLFLTDDLPQDGLVFQRTVTSAEELIFRLDLHPDIRDCLSGGTLTLTMPQGATVFSTVRTAEDQTTTLTVRNGTIESAGDHTYRIRIQNGDILYHGFGQIQEPLSEEPLTHTANPVIDRMITYISHVILSQTSQSGGILAGYPYHLGYVRDTCCGVLRGLLAMGQKRTARGIIDFFTDAFRKTGCVHNAHPLGYGIGYHEHENDCVEIPGYILLSLYEYVTETGDIGFLSDHLDIIDWAVTVQAGQLFHGMIPFNGDETYIAGGILPRTVMDHGSCEATLLFILYTERLSGLLWKNGLITGEKYRAYMEKVLPAKEHFSENFVVGDKLYVNHPGRDDGTLVRPETRRGVCVYCGRYVTDLHPIGHMYACPTCAETASDIRDTHRYMIPSVALMSVYLGADLIPEEQLKAIIFPSIDAFADGKSTGKIVGYEGGLLLYAAVHFHYREKETAARLLAEADEFGSYSEYYENDRQSGTLCRPWESAINIEALIRYAADPA